MWYGSVPEGKVTCEECEDAWKNQPPCRTWDGSLEKSPCHESRKPELDHDNIEPVNLWLILNQHGRDLGFGISPIRLEAALMLCSAYDADLMIFERVMIFERTIYPLIIDSGKKK